MLARAIRPPHPLIAAWVLAASSVLPRGVWAEAQAPAAESVRPAQVAGQFYPEEPVQLRTLVTSLLEAQPKASLAGPVRILISPHAGYPYSGPVAAKAFRQVQGSRYDAVVVVGFTHQIGFAGASVDDRAAYETPLGRVPVDTEAASRLREAHARLAYRAEAHAHGEHSLEVMLPFLQVALGEFRLVPVLMGNATLLDAQILSEALAELAGQGNYLFVFSTDLSHYHPYDQAKGIDEGTLDAILHETPQAVSRLFDQQRLEACGRGPIVTSLVLAAKLGHLERVLLDYANSGDTAGDRSRVVGYGAVAMVKRPQEAAERLSAEAGQALVRAARRWLELSFTPGFERMDASLGLERYPELNRSTGIFVTLRKDSRLHRTRRGGRAARTGLSDRHHGRGPARSPVQAGHRRRAERAGG
jgi:hypothetical protein